MMILWGMTGCGSRKEPTPDGDSQNQMLDGPGMVYTPEDQTPFAGTWRDADSIVVLEIEGQGAYERSRIKASAGGEPAFEAEIWVHAAGNVRLTQDHKEIPPPEPFRTLTFNTAANAFVAYLASEEILLLKKEKKDGALEDSFKLSGAPNPNGDYVRDGDGMFYTPENQAPFAGTWQSRDGSIVMKVERSGGPDKKSQMRLLVNGETDFEAEMWVYSTGHVELSRGKEKLSISGTFCDLRFSTVENAFYGYLTDDRGTIWLTKDGAECGEKDVIHAEQPRQPEQSTEAWVCLGCKTENTGKFCTECGALRPAACGKCGWQPADGKLSIYCPECGSRLK